MTGCIHRSLIAIAAIGLLGGCLSVPEWQSRPPILFYGEIHGTQEIPEHFSLLVKDQVRKRGFVSVGLEITSNDIRTACQSVRGTISGASSGDWTNAFQDGRHSLAMAKLTCRLMRTPGVSLFALVSDDSSPLRDKMIADSISENAKQGRATLVLVGNYRARNVESSAAGLVRAAGWPVVTYVFDARGRSQAWIRTANERQGPQDVGARFCSTNDELAMAGVIVKDTPGVRWDRCVSLEKLTASFPIERR